MTTALDVAQHVYNRLGWVDAWKLEKLTYFAQAWHLAWDGRPLFDDEFEAWQDGPVVRKLHRINKYDRPNAAGDPYSTVLPGADTSTLSEQSMQIVDAVLKFYGEIDTQDLIEMTHNDSPWLNARGDVGRHAQSNEALSITDMRRCYTVKAISGEPNIPAPPAAQPAVVSGGELYQAAVDFEIERWSETLALLAER